MTMEQYIGDAPVVRAHFPAWFISHLSSTARQGGARNFVMHSVGDPDTTGADLFPISGAEGDLVFRPAAPHHPSNLIVSQTVIRSSGDIDTFEKRLAPVMTTKEFRILVATDRHYLNELTEAAPFVTCLDTLCDRFSAALKKPCLIEGTGKLHDGDKSPDGNEAYQAIFLRVFG